MRLSRLHAIPAGIVALYVVATLTMCQPDFRAFASILSMYAKSLISVWLMAGFSALLFVMVRQHLAGAPVPRCRSHANIS